MSIAYFKNSKIEAILLTTYNLKICIHKSTSDILKHSTNIFIRKNSQHTVFSNSTKSILLNIKY